MNHKQVGQTCYVQLQRLYRILLLSGKMTIFAHGYILISQKQR